jgi:hypothetical protein
MKFCRNKPSSQSRNPPQFSSHEHHFLHNTHFQRVAHLHKRHYGPARHKYTLSRPVNILLPYFLTLVLAFVLLLVGLWALWTNGVSATDGGFLQVLMTTRSSEALGRAASCGCLGGGENIPQGIRSMEIMFGEFIGKSGEHWGEAEHEPN